VALSISEIFNALEMRSGAVAEELNQYLVIPGNSGPRWLIPARSRASASVMSAWRPYTIPSQMKWFAIRTAARTGILQIFRFVSIATASRNGALRWFERCGIRSQAGEIVILTGNPSPDRKLICFLLDDTQRIAAVLKVGLTAGGGLSIVHEAEALRKLERYHWAPKLLSVHPDLRAAAQKYVCGSMPDRRFRPEYMELLCHLPRTGGSKSLVDVADEMAKRLSPFKTDLDKMAPGLLDRSLEYLTVDITVPTMLVHGDFVPWNIRNNPEVGHVLVDWEWADFAGLPAYDLLHFQFNDDHLFGGKAGCYPAIRSSSICAEYFRRMDLDLELLPRLAIAYLLDQLKVFDKQMSSEHAAYLLRQLAAIIGHSEVISSQGSRSRRKL
jgi:hypothetical protein